LLAVACDRAPSPAEIVDRSWRAHELVIAAGEHASTCRTAAAAMRAVFALTRDAFAEARLLEGDAARFAEATSYLQQHGTRYAALDTRMAALADRCGDHPAVMAVFRDME
jgi:hypothetical protein